jgi:type I restriction enzyme S subunit
MAETLFRQWFVEEAGEDWGIVKIGNFVKTNISSITKDTTLQTIQYLDTGSLTEGKIDGFQKFDMSDAPSRARRIVKHNDVLISTVRPNQKHYGIIKHPNEDIIISTGFCVITCDKINPHFIYIFLTTEEITEYLHSIAEGSTSAYPSLKPSDIENLEFQLPPEEKLKAFSKYADNAWNKIEYNHIQIGILEKIRDTLLPKLMSGEIRVAI